MLRVLRSVAVLILVSAVALGQKPTEPVPAPSQNGRIGALQSMLEPLKGVTGEIDRLRAEQKAASSADLKESIQRQIDAERARLQKLRENFRDIVGGAEAAEYEGATAEELSLERQVRDLFQPAVSALREASSGPRELEVLRQSLAKWMERQRKAEVVLERIKQLRTGVKDPAMLAEFDSTEKLWQGRMAECVGQIGVINSQIDEREARRKPLWETLSGLFSQFFRNRGLNLVLALLSGIACYILTRKAYSLFRRYSPMHRRERGTLAGRISDILAMSFAVLMAVWGVMLVFYIRADWLLLTVVALMLLGAAWAGKHSLPPHIHQIRTLLNLGSIREGERVMHQGLPWKVQSLGWYSVLSNPNLEGGELRIPVKNLMDMVSREADAKEPWFPTEAGDWVLLQDGVFGKVITQTPEQVVVLRLGGSLKTYSSEHFLEQHPENLSHGFRVTCIFGIDYRHQSIATTEVPEVLELALTNAIIAKVGREALRSVKVELSAAGSSSLDYQINVDVDGSCASRYQALQRLVQKACVETCNEKGWVIPFTQITVHQAG